MVISDNPNYLGILEIIINEETDNLLKGLLMGKQNIIDKWINHIESGVNSLGPKSKAILTRDIGYIVDKIHSNENKNK